MSVHRYPKAALAADYLRAGIGAAAAAAPMLFAPHNPVIVTGLSGIAGLFMLFGLRTALRQVSRVEMTDQDIALVGPALPGYGGVRIPWSELSGMRLRYYSTRRDRSNGWMNLKLRAPGRRELSVDSAIAGFEQIVSRAARTAERRGVQLDAHSRANLAALGLDPTPPGDAPAEAPAKAHAP